MKAKSRVFSPQETRRWKFHFLDLSMSFQKTFLFSFWAKWVFKLRKQKTGFKTRKLRKKHHPNISLIFCSSLVIFLLIMLIQLFIELILCQARVTWFIFESSQMPAMLVCVLVQFIVPCSEKSTQVQTPLFFYNGGGMDEGQQKKKHGRERERERDYHVKTD